MTLDVGVISIEFEEAESRMLAAVLVAVQPYLNQEQQEIAAGVSEKFVAASMERIAQLLAVYGRDEAERLAAQFLAEHPCADERLPLPPPAFNGGHDA